MLFRFLGVFSVYTMHSEYAFQLAALRQFVTHGQLGNSLLKACMQRGLLMGYLFSLAI